MDLIDLNNSMGDVVELARTHANHLNSRGQKKELTMEEDSRHFGNLMTTVVERVSDKQHAAEELFRRMITNPDEVEPHDVTIAMAQANMSLNLTKTIVDRAVKAYNDIMTMR